MLLHRRADSGNWSLPGGTILVSDESTEVHRGAVWTPPARWRCAVRR
ncbi:hypothetical protein [Micromonospora sp. LOL_021]